MPRSEKMLNAVAQAAFVAGLPMGPNEHPIPGHTTWNQLGPKAKERQRRIAEAVIDEFVNQLKLQKEANDGP